MSPQSMVYVVFGILLCFMGYSLFRSMLPLWGFMLGGWIGFVLLPVVAPDLGRELLYQAVAFGVVGLIGAIIAVPLYYLIIFLSGAALGMVVGVMAGALVDLGGITSVRQMMAFLEMSFPPIPQTITQFAAMIVLGFILGGLSMNFQKFMIIASSSFLGAAAIMTGLTGPVAQMTNTTMSQGATMLMGWIIIGTTGMLAQFRLTGEV